MKKALVLIALLITGSAFAQQDIQLKLYVDAIKDRQVDKLRKYRALNLNLNQPVGKSTPLLLALETGDITIIEEVVVGGKANVNYPYKKENKTWNPRGGRYGNGGYTSSFENVYPIMVAVEKKLYLVITFLLDQGADGKPALEMVERSGNSRLISKFKNYGMNYSYNDVLEILKNGSSEKAVLQILNQGVPVDGWSMVYAIKGGKHQAVVMLASKYGIDGGQQLRNKQGKYWSPICECIYSASFPTLKYLVEQKYAKLTGTCSKGNERMSYLEYATNGNKYNPQREAIIEYLALAPAREAELQAQKAAQITRHREEAKQALQEQRHRDAIDLYRKAFRLSQATNDLHSIGHAMITGKQFNEAFTHYKSYIAYDWSIVPEKDVITLLDHAFTQDISPMYKSILLRAKSKEMLISRAAMYVRLGDEKEALKILKEVQSNHGLTAERLANDQLFDPIRSSKAYQKFVERLWSVKDSYFEKPVRRRMGFL